MTAVLTPLCLTYIDGDDWLVKGEYRCHSDVVGDIRIDDGTYTDFNSVPRILTNLLPREEYGEAALPHDVAYKTGRLAGRILTRAEADRVHREFVIWAGVRRWVHGELVRVGETPRWKVHAFYWGLRAFGWTVWNAYRRAEQAPQAG